MWKGATWRLYQPLLEARGQIWAQSSLYVGRYLSDAEVTNDLFRNMRLTMNAVIIMQPSSAHSSNIFLVRSNIFQFAPPAVKTKWTYCNLTVIAELFYISFCLQQPGTLLGSQGRGHVSAHVTLVFSLTWHLPEYFNNHFKVLRRCCLATEFLISVSVWIFV